MHGSALASRRCAGAVAWPLPSSCSATASHRGRRPQHPSCSSTPLLAPQLHRPTTTAALPCRASACVRRPPTVAATSTMMTPCSRLQLHARPPLPPARAQPPPPRLRMRRWPLLPRPTTAAAPLGHDTLPWPAAPRVAAPNRLLSSVLQAGHLRAAAASKGRLPGLVLELPPTPMAAACCSTPCTACVHVRHAASSHHSLSSPLLKITQMQMHVISKRRNGMLMRR